MFKKLILLFFLYFGNTFFYAQINKKEIITPHVHPGLTFTENRGQWDNTILYRAQLDGGALFLEKNKLTFNLYDKKKCRSFHFKKYEKGAFIDDVIKGHAFNVVFEGSNTNVSTEANQKGDFYENYFLGNDKSKWKGNVANFHQIWYKNLYNNIDYEIITSINGVKYNFHVKPGAEVNNIKLKYNGIENISLKKGVLYIKPQINEIIENKPYAFQYINGKVVEVKCDFKLKENVLSYEFPEGYNKNYELVIDPVLVFAAQSGSTADNFGMTATYDTQGNLYSGGTIFNIGYPVTVGAYSSSFFGPSYYGNTDVVITKYNSIGSNLLYSTYFGGGNTETVNSLIVDNSNNLCFYGVTSSTNFPTSTGAYDNSFNGGSFLMYVFNGMRFINGTDIYISKLSPNGSSLLASTYLGGSGNDGINQTDNFTTYLVPAVPPATGNVPVNQPNYDSLQTNYGDQCRGEIQVDVSNNIYITSSTRSTDFPNVNSFDNTLGGKQDGILAKFNNNLSSLQYCSFIGGSSTDAGYGLVVKNNFEVYVTGGTTSNDFPFMGAGYQNSYQGGVADGYVIRVNAAGNNVLNATYFGTPLYDQSFFIQTDKKNNIYIYGQSLGNIPVVVAPTATTVFSVPGTHQFISRLNPGLSSLNMSTVFGNYPTYFDISPSAFSVDKCSNIYISGWGANFLLSGLTLTNMPLALPTQSVTDGNDFYFMGLDSNASTLKYGSYFGGGLSEEHVDGGTSRFDPQGRIYQSVCAGCGGNDDFPVTPGAWPCGTITACPPGPNLNSNCNNGVIKLDFQLQLAISTINTNTLAGCLPVTINFTNATAPTGSLATFIWYLGNGQTTTTNINPTVTYTNPGTYTVSLVVKDPATCNVKDSAVTYITVYPKPTTNFTLNVSPCSNTLTATNTSTGNLGSNPYVWNFGNGVTSTLTSPSYSYPASGSYTVSLLTTDLNGCTDVKTNTVSIFNFNPGVINGGTICEGFATPLSASGGTSYTWTPSSGLSNTNIASPIATPSITTVYSVQIDNNSQGYTCSRTLTAQVTVYPKPTADYTYTTNPCGGGVNFFDLSVPLISSWQWTLSSAITSTVQNPYNFYFTGGTHTVSLIVTDNNGCKDTADKVITVLVPPAVSINPNKIICKGDKAVLLASGGMSYQWTPTVSLDISNIPGPTASPTANTQYSCVVTTSNNCSFLLTTDVTITQISTIPISANANPVIIVQGNSSNLTYNGDPGSIVTWSPGNSVSPSSGYSVTATPDRSTTYTVTIKNGPCRETLTVYVEVNLSGCIDSDVFIPNTFTPNGDGNNDILYVRGLKVQETYFAVYNRWGEMVWETTDKTKGWDGIYKGKPADVGVFGWYLKVKCFDGQETFKKGNVTLIR
ncbi:MAG: PKD domain-containing protein [Bacteroidota bacterium]|nr:PKD domain-containing protein [Bacteroidota bacterium]